MNYTLLAENLQPEIVALEKLIGDITDINRNVDREYSYLLIEITQYIIASGGKRLRPLILLLTAKMFGYSDSNHHIKLAAVIELIHTATLLHDDIIDNSTMRRNQISAHLKWGVRNSVIAGDWLFAQAFDLVTATKNISAIKIVSRMTKSIANGELEQLYFKNQQNISKDTYFVIIAAKTGLLFEAATLLAAVIAGQSEEILNYAKLFGMHLGLAFQIKDDLLDYTGVSGDMGKNLGDDLREGKLTLPMIYLRERDYKQFKEIMGKVKNNCLVDQDIILLQQAFDANNIIKDSYTKVVEQQNLALQYLHKLNNNSDNVYQQALYKITAQIADRTN